MTEVDIKFRWIDDTCDLSLPRYMTAGSAGMDLYAATEDDIIVKSGEIASVSTGFAMAVPRGFEAQIRPRSGLAARGIGIINSPGTIDADYRGEVKILLINHARDDFIVSRGDRIAQMVIKRVYRANIEVVDELDDTKRGAGGFGHTGL